MSEDEWLAEQVEQHRVNGSTVTGPEVSESIEQVRPPSTLRDPPEGNQVSVRFEQKRGIPWKDPLDNSPHVLRIGSLPHPTQSPCDA